MKVDFQKYKLIIVDMDGTLYYQKPVRLAMGIKLVKGILTGGIKSVKELLIVLEFRKIRENEKVSEEIVCKRISGKYDLSEDDIENIIYRWMKKIPLTVIPKYADDILCKKLLELKDKGINVSVFSDYPASDKCKVLGIEGIPSWNSDMEEIGELKPSPKGILYIMDNFKVSNAKDVLMIGDRMSRDGMSAEAAGCDKLILPREKKKRMSFYHKIGL